MILGAPDHFVAESSQENALLYWRDGNHSSIANNLETFKKALNKLEYIIPMNMIVRLQDLCRISFLLRNIWNQRSVISLIDLDRLR